MRTRFALAVISLLALFAAMGSFMPAATQAAPAQQPAVTGTLVATPQATVPTTLLLQVGGQTIPVSITSATQVVDRANNPLSLTSLNDGDTLRVIGEPNAAGGVNASVVEDLSTTVTPPPPPTYQVTVQGTLAWVRSDGTLLCLSGASVIGTNIRAQVATVNPCTQSGLSNSGSWLPVTLTGATQFFGPGGQAYSLGQLALGDTLQASGSFASAQFTAATVQDLTTTVTPPPPPTYQVTVQGTLAWVRSDGTLLCLSGASVIGTNIRAQVATVNPCTQSGLSNSGSWLPVTLTGATQFFGPGGQAYSLGQLALSDTLQASGSFASAQFTAATVQDLTTYVTPPPPPTYPLTIQGTLASEPSHFVAPMFLCLSNVHVTGGAIRSQVATVSPCSAGQLPVYVTSSTRIMHRFGARGALDELRAGDSLLVSGTFANAQFIARQIRDVSVARIFNRLVGTVEYINFGNGPYFVMRMLQNGRYVTVTVYVQGNTQFVGNGTSTNDVTVLNPGQTVTVLGVYDGHTHHCTSTLRVIIR